MQYFGTIVGAILPLIIYILIGFALCSFYRFTDDQMKALNKICFCILLPALVFKPIYTLDSFGSSLGKSAFIAMAAIILMPVVSSIVAVKFIPDKSQQAAFAVCSWKHNSGIVGLPIAKTLLNSDGMASYIVFIACGALFGSIVMTVQASFHMGGGVGKKELKAAALNVAKNPIVYAVLAAGILRFGGITLPQMAEDIVFAFDACVSPICLVLVGCNIAMNHGITHYKLAAGACFLKLIFTPVVMGLIAYAIGMRGGALAGVIMAQAVPTAVNSVILVHGIGGDGKLASELVFATTVVSAITIFCFAFVIFAIQGA